MNHVLKKLLGVGVLIASTALTIPAASSIAAPPETNPPHPMGIRGGANVNGIPEQAGTKPSRTTSNGISYHNGPIMTGPVKGYIIWYGNWAGTTTPTLKQTIITDFLKNVGGSPYYNINTTYTGYNGTVSNAPDAVSLGSETTDNYSQGQFDLSDASIGKVVSTAITSGRLPKDPNGVYFVLTSSDVTKTGFLTNYCGWHTHAALGGTDIKYSFVGDADNGKGGLTSCAAQATSPNGDAGADAMVSVIAHELEETTTDPDLNAWYDSRGMENADKCAWTFGTTSTLSSGAQYNMTLGSRNFLIQRNWVNALGGSCTLAY